MEEAIRQFHTQFLWKPVIVNPEKLLRARRFVIGGMGGSHLAGSLLLGLDSELEIIIHRDYGLPAHTDGRDTLYIASSYSGNTEETLDFARTVLEAGYALAIISIGGKLLEFAQTNNLSHVVIPDTKIQPRSALGFALVALAALMGDAKRGKELAELASVLKPEELRGAGKELADELRGKVPVIYASARNQAVAYNWKIKFNETAKIPAFYNVFPELNHNEMTGFDVISTTEGLSRKLHFIFLTDSADHSQNQKRMQVCKKLYEDRGLSVTEVPLEGKSTLGRIFSSLLIADWTALHLSRMYGTEAEQVPMVEQFKKMIS